MFGYQYLDKIKLRLALFYFYYILSIEKKLFSIPYFLLKGIPTKVKKKRKVKKKIHHLVTDVLTTFLRKLTN